MPLVINDIIFGFVMLELNNITLRRGDKSLLENASVRIERNQKVGLVGRNGAGKSSVIKMLIGDLVEDSGDVSLSIKRSEIVYLEQSLPQTDLTALEYAQGGDKEWYTINQKLIKAEKQQDGLTISDCHERLREIDGYNITGRATKVLLGLGFDANDLQLPVSHFSGGWQMRIQLARVLLSQGQLLLLDEPTNHLDIDAIIWLEDWIKQCNVTAVIISHDRDFLDNVTTHTIHLSNMTFKFYTGGYSAFTRLYSLQLEVQSRQAQRLQEKRNHMQDFVNRFRAKASKAKQAQSRLKALEKLSDAPAMIEESAFHFDFRPAETVGGYLINFAGGAGYADKTVIETCRLNIKSDDRIGIIGKNGEGKSTLLKTLAQVIPPLNGEYSIHPKANIGYFTQQQMDMLDLDSTPLQSLSDVDPLVRESEARRFLGGFNFIGDRVFDKVSKFSGGEKARLALALMIYSQPNVLLLDEPTNHLDIQMRDAFILALQNFEGALILVSHDRYFMSSVVNEVWHVSDSKLSRFSGDLSDYNALIIEKDQPRIKSNTKQSQVKKENLRPQSHSSKGNQKQIQRLERKLIKLRS